MSLVGIYGEGSLDDLQAMAAMMPHRGENLIAWSPANGVYLGELQTPISNRRRIELLALDLDVSADYDAVDQLSLESIALQQPDRFIGRIKSQGLESVLRGLNNFFALAYWDEENHRLVLACDRMFYKNLYWINLSSRIAFASEYKAFLALPDCAARPNRTAMQHYLRSKTAHECFCMLDGVRSVGPSRYLEITRENIKLRDYWVPKISHSGRSLQENTEILSQKLQQAIIYQSRMHSIIGCTLSGGVDSTVLLALCKKVRPEAAISTFTVGYNHEDPEIIHARETADHIGTDHHELIANIEELPMDLPQIVWRTEDCHGREETWLATLILKELSRYVDNVMSGLFADVLFCGMPRYRLLWMRDIAPLPLRNSLGEVYHYTQTKQRPQSVLGRFLVNKAYSKDILKRPVVIGASEETFQVPASINDYRVEKLKLMAGWLYHEPLEKELNLHVMNPFCDRDVIELALTMPISHMINWKLQKRVLRRVAQGLLPNTILKRAKAIQRLQHDQQLTQVLQSMAETMLKQDGLAGRNLVPDDYIRGFFNRNKSAAYSMETVQLLWALISLELWCKQFLDLRGKPLIS